ncbi:high affinity cAMP-specific and IBMX-insensitive 3',5'-cyclic phosphodiesterase 8A isoform X3 [Eurytemora carolleeae]|nr:high affinity cAMP-specific and IBMX-insensitive 3',5'-cyclic phosphodiesterase 8A isoform X3 [Eurytemora carolleeae]|eukprot:XP_023340227.1 high affinity cAMP-specific and IBMX-insensitive 3',5'-cyclic phosphodiesterase 8A-like isoform X3 [Eurytemora affinis]
MVGVGETARSRLQEQQQHLPDILAAGASQKLLHALAQAALHLGLSFTSFSDHDSVISTHTEKGQTLIILDLKPGDNYQPEPILRYLRNSGNFEDCVIVGVLEKQKLEHYDTAVISWVDLGINQIVLESVYEVYWINQLVQLLHGPVRLLQLQQTTRILYKALDKTRDIVQITDKEDKVVWVNHRAEKELGWFKEELVGKNLSTLQTTGHRDIMNSDNSPAEVDQVLHKRLVEGKEWEGPINCQRKTGDYVPLSAKVIPVSFSNLRKLDQILYIKHVVSSPTPFRHNRHSIRRPSAEITALPNHEARRRSSGKPHPAAMEAPINKVLNIILAAQENQPLYIAQALDKVVDILKSSGSSELFNPDVEEEDGRTGRSHDLVTKDLFGALLANPRVEVPKHQLRRTSIDKIVSFSPRPSLPTLEVTPVQIGELFNTAIDWGFDIFKLEEVTERRPLLWLGMNILQRFDVTTTLGIEESILQNWLNMIEANYHSSNSYHNSTHAADVLQASAFFLEQSRIQEMFDPIDELIILIGAIIHDVDHPGRNSAYLINSGSQLAVLYNDTTVLENHHCALGYKLTISHESVNIFQNLDSDTYKTVRKGLIDTVLATDMSKHFIHVNKFTTAICSRDIEEKGPPKKALSEVEEKGIIRRMLIKCADVSNPARTLNLCKEWAVRIAEEYFTQTAEEKSMGLPVVMPQFDRTTCSIPQSQIGFYDYFILSMFDAWAGYINSSELMENIEENYEYWKKKLAEEQEAERKLNSRGEKINKLRAARERRETEPSSPSPTCPTSPASPASTITSDINNPESNSLKSEPRDVVSPNPEKVLDPVLATSPIPEKIPSPVPSNPLTPERILDPAPS